MLCPRCRQGLHQRAQCDRPDDAVRLARDLQPRASSWWRHAVPRQRSADGIECGVVNKVIEGRPHVVDMIKNDQIDLIVNTTEGKQAIADSFTIRASR